MFLPTTREELKKLGWSQLDVILVTGDTYIDTPFDGVVIIGKELLRRGYKVGIIAQPNIEDKEDITRLGEPRLFWGVTGGCVDSMVANYTATKKRKKQDDYTPGGVNNRRPDRALISYCNLIRKHFKNTVPLVIGGIEASLRRISHYDFWSNKVRRSILFDAKADYLVYGMGEKATVELAEKLKKKESAESIRGICYTSRELKEDYLELPEHGRAASDKKAFIKMFNVFYENKNPLTAKGLCQKQDSRYLIQNPPAYNMTEEELDRISDLKYEREAHPYYAKQGKIRALDTIRFSLTTHRGCYGECNFCAIAIHQGTTVYSRSEKSILKEAEQITKHKSFKGNIMDVGGPTANMYSIECKKKLTKGNCADKRCLFPTACPSLKTDHTKQINLLKKLRGLSKVKKVFIASGVRYDLLLDDKKKGKQYLKELVENHISGQMKVAPEHTEDNILNIMGKPGKSKLRQFKDMFDNFNRQAGKKQFLTYYLIAAHPGCEEQDMRNLKSFTSKELKIQPEQVQVFTPTPSTYSTLMYYTEMNPFTGEKIFVEKDIKRKEKQKDVLVQKRYEKKGLTRTLFKKKRC